MNGTVDVVIEDPRWEDVDLGAIGAKIFATLAVHVPLPDGAEAVVMGCNDDRIAALNTQFRDKPTPTNVLSWPTEDRAASKIGGVPDAATDPELGDIALAFETCQREAAEQGKSFDAHVTHLYLHGLLHLLGYDHIEDADAELMELTEVAVLASLGYSNPYEHAVS